VVVCWLEVIHQLDSYLSNIKDNLEFLHFCSENFKRNMRYFVFTELHMTNKVDFSILMFSLNNKANLLFISSKTLRIKKAK